MILFRVTLRFLALLLLFTVLLLLVQLDRAQAALELRMPGSLCTGWRGGLYEIGSGPVTVWRARLRRPRFCTWTVNYPTRFSQRHL